MYLHVKHGKNNWWRNKKQKTLVRHLLNMMSFSGKHTSFKPQTVFIYFTNPVTVFVCSTSLLMLRDLILQLWYQCTLTYIHLLMLIHNVIRKTWLIWSGRLLSWWWVSCEGSTSSYREINRNTHMHRTRTVATEEHFKKAHTLCSHDHSCPCLSHVWAHIDFVCPWGQLSSLCCLKKISLDQTLNQNLFHNMNMHAQMVCKDFLASNLLLSCFSLNRFRMLSMQVCWHIAWCMRLI